MIHIDGTDSIHVAYYPHLASDQLKYAFSTNGGSSWTLELVCSADIHSSASMPSFAKRSDRKFIAYQSTEYKLSYASPTVTGIETPSFTATSESYYIELHWRPEMENGCLQYLILKKSIRDDKDYHEIARIPGSGSSPLPRTYSYKDEDIEPGTRYYYKLCVVKLNGNIEWYGPVSAVVTRINRYLKVSPNPCKDKVSIRYCSGQSAEDIELKIYDVSGKLVKSFSLPTAYSILPTVVPWDTRDNYGRLLPSGIYICALEVGKNKKTEKILIVR